MGVTIATMAPGQGGTDVVVVGGGPAGATASYRLERFGYDTVVVDAAEFPREKLCGGLLTDKTARLLERVFGDDVAALRADGVVDYSTPGYEVRFGDDLVARGEDDRPFHFVDRSTYDHYLFRRAVDAGADAVTGDAVTDVDPDAGTVVTESGRTLQGDHVVAADGAVSTIRRRLVGSGRLDADGWRRNLAMGAEVTVPRAAVPRDVECLLLHFGVVDWGYGWVFPNTDRLVVGVGGLNRANDDFRALLGAYLDRLGVDADPAVDGHPIPFGNFLPEPAAGRVLLAGDAAGAVDPITGEGVFYAQRCGELAAWAIRGAGEDASGDPAAVADRYVELLAEHVHPELRISRRVRPLLWAGPAGIRRRLMHLWLGARPGTFVELVQGARVYAWLGRRGEERHDVVPGSPADGQLATDGGGTRE